MESAFPMATWRTAPYPAISPSRPELSQAGRTVLVCGASTGIGYSIAKAFCAAKAGKVVMLGRRQDVLDKAAQGLAGAHPDTQVAPRVCDIFDEDAAGKLWAEFEAEGTVVDVLVWSGVHFPAFASILKQGVKRLWEDLESNVRMPLLWVEKLYNQPGGADRQKSSIYVTTKDIARWGDTEGMPGYQLSKSAGTCAMQQVARDVPVAELQMVSMHPGVIFTEACEAAGYTRDTLPWAHDDLPGHFAVWAASPEAEFLHGRYVWVNWDVEDLQKGEIRDKLDADPWYLKVGIKGL
ncbi:uncharacterized protein B0I36DRAFT_389332 [Microdochium trichocladiopsis]|uniref:Uncharacterized protein n=1 Tax=Microdochium trichocladiopsis TaxID=1682393 RepID=A0A9P8XTS2_9PEZI|nr:uncharacterized protein B0I36DRAFT_389332 [Microdochium trichocladiopsis]KAH7014436.1 hypothetical protein B0I36DRAFT_389332 [Microdochium trichocladiopsis]